MSACSSAYPLIPQVNPQWIVEGGQTKVLTVGLEDLMHAFDRHATFADRGGATFNRAGTYVACDENTGPTRFPALP